MPHWPTDIDRLFLRRSLLSAIVGNMESSSRHILYLLGALAVAVGVDSASAMALQQPGPGIVVLHFARSTSGTSGGPCQQGENSGRARTLFREYRTAAGPPLTISGHVALRFKASTSERQIDSLIAATGIEAFTAANRSKCRRYVFRLVHPEDDPIAIANALRESGLVVYATPDLAAGRPEGISSDSFFVDPIALSAISRNVVATDAAPATYGMGQVLSEYTGPVMRVDGAALSAQISGVTSSASALEMVKAHGITTLRVEIPDRSPAATVRVILYSLNGTPVRQLVSEALQAGHYLVGWDGMDDRGRRVQPGVYVAVMTAGSFRETHRLVIR
jgi:flagellar hook capping protein FlgD